MAATRPRIYATCDIGKEALDVLRNKGYDLEVYSSIEASSEINHHPKSKKWSGCADYNLRDQIDEEVFAAGQEHAEDCCSGCGGF